jgi:hypothetical protein
MNNSYIKDLARVNRLKGWRAKKIIERTAEVAALKLLWYKCRAHYDVEPQKIYIVRRVICRAG